MIGNGFGQPVIGIREKTIDIMWGPGQSALALLEFVVVRFEGYTGPAWFLDPRYLGYVIIPLVKTTSSALGDDIYQEPRQSLPFALYVLGYCYAH